jgi:hypothetical protein
MTPTLIPPERPASNTTQLAFVLHGEYWWPAITYTSYGQAMEERHETLSLKTKNMLAFKMIDEHHANLNKYGKSDEILRKKICQVLGYEDEWIEFNDQRSIYVFLPQAVAQNLPQALQPAFSQALQQVRELLGSCTKTTTSDSSSILQNSTSAAPEVSSPRIWGREKTCIGNDLDDSKSKNKENISQSIHGKKRTPSKTFKNNKKRRSNTSQGVGLSNKSSELFKTPVESGESEDDKTLELGDGSHHSISSISHISTHNTIKKSFAQVWRHLRQQGWTMIDARKYNLKDDAVWYWVRPSVVDIKASTRGVDYFTSTEELMQWVDANEDKIFDEAVTTPPNCLRTTPQDPGKPLLRGSGDCKESENSEDKWKHLWNRLLKYGWYWKKGNGLHDYYYVRPNKSIKTGKLGVDFFASEQEVIEFEKRRDSMEERLQRSDEDIYILNEQSASRIPLTPEVNTKEASDDDLEWWRTEPVPGNHQIWYILNHTFSFRFSFGVYHLPKGVDHPEAQCMTFSDRELRQFLCRYGIPNLDKVDLTPEKMTTLIRWVKFANVPVNSCDSVSKLQKMKPSKPVDVFSTLGIKQEKKSNRYRWGDLEFDCLEDLRVYIRGLPNLEPESVGRRRSRSSLDPDSTLRIRLWAALSPMPLVKFQEKNC